MAGVLRQQDWLEEDDDVVLSRWLRQEHRSRLEHRSRPTECRKPLRDIVPIEDPGDANAVEREHAIDAVLSVDRVDETAREEGYPSPSDMAKNKARGVLRGLLRKFPRLYEVYPTSEGEIAIEAPGIRGRGVLILCDSRGGAACFVTIDHENRRARYNDAAKLPDAFVIQALQEQDEP